MERLNLTENKIHKGYYIKETQKYFCYFIKNNEGLCIDVITKDDVDIDKFYTVDYDYDIIEYKHILKCFKKTKNPNLFLEKSIDYKLKYTIYSRILRFFELENYDIIFEKGINKDILNNVIVKIQKYYKRYIGYSESINYVKQLKYCESIIEMLTTLPKQLYEKKIPFWINDLNELQYFQIILFDINDVNDYNKFNLNILLCHKDRELNKKIIFDLIDKIRSDEEKDYEKMCSSKILDRLREARLTLDNELFIAKQNNDEDLIFEISIISDELQKIEDDISQIDFYNDAIYWWPELLYPVPFVDQFIRNEEDVFMLERIHDHYATIV